jgi:quercetin dioxygenase-like cupin family protein
MFELGGTTVRVVTATEPATVLEVTLEAGSGAGPHTHTREEETIAVLDGRLLVDDGTRRELGAGEAHVLPRGLRHSFANESDAPVRALFFCAPGGLERFFRDVAAADTDEAVAAAAARAGLRFG